MLFSIKLHLINVFLDVMSSNYLPIQTLITMDHYSVDFPPLTFFKLNVSHLD